MSFVLGTKNGINNSFIPNHKVEDDKILTAMFEDEIYGLSKIDNMSRWNMIMESQDATARAALIADLKSTFGLTQAQIDEFQTTWTKQYNDDADVTASITPAGGDNVTTEGIGYWQWAEAYLTETLMDAPTVAKIVNSVSGYAEISYFKSEYFEKTVNKENVETFKDVKLFTDESDNTANFETLFKLEGLKPKDAPKDEK